MSTLRPLGAQARDVKCAQARRISLLKQQVTFRNITNVTALISLRMRSKTVRATYKRDWECIPNLKPRKFLREPPEGDGDAALRQEALLTYIDAHLPLIDSMATRIRLSETATERWTQANRSGGRRHGAWMELNEAIAVELLRREGEVTRTAQTDDQDSAQAQGNPTTPKYPAQFAARIEKECLAEDLGVRKPTVKDKLKASVARNYADNNIAETKKTQDQFDGKLALERVKRRSNKQRKRLIKEYRVRMDSRRRGFDPNSDNEEYISEVDSLKRTVLL